MGGEQHICTYRGRQCELSVNKGGNAELTGVSRPLEEKGSVGSFLRDKQSDVSPEVFAHNIQEKQTGKEEEVCRFMTSWLRVV